jgi:DNA primase small subunit
VDYLIARFREYYKNEEVVLPERFGRREFGFMFFGVGMVQRHMAFGSGVHLRKFLLQRAPRHVYHSAAYYENPGAPTMDEKGWLGADLIFDLDADHVPASQGLPYEQMLEVVKGELIYLLDEFILGDFGFTEEDVTITFSGGRGYHIHVRHPSILGLKSHERREIVDYIRGVGLHEDWLFRRVPYDATKWEPKYRVLAPSPEDPAWMGRTARNLLAAVEELESMSDEDAARWLSKHPGIGPSAARKILDALFEGEKGRRGVDRLRAGSVDFFPDDRHLNLFLRAAMEETLERGRGETDEPVTSDIKRLIRLQGSLHGKTGLRVVEVRRDGLKDFNPLRNALADTFREGEVPVRVQSPVRIRMNGETYNLDAGESRVPEYVAILLMCRGAATLVGSGS